MFILYSFTCKILWKTPETWFLYSTVKINSSPRFRSMCACMCECVDVIDSDTAVMCRTFFIYLVFFLFFFLHFYVWTINHTVSWWKTSVYTRTHWGVLLMCTSTIVSVLFWRTRFVRITIIRSREPRRENCVIAYMAAMEVKTILS